MIAKTPEPPYYVVTFTSIRTDDENGYDEMATKMADLSAAQPGFLGMEHAMNDGLSITICYWDSLESIDNWKRNVEHRVAQETGMTRWYQAFATRVARVERDNLFTKPI
jgi:heme-degrading monooxygenase HmoA